MNKKYKFTISASKASRLAHVDKTIEVTQGTTTHIVAKGGERFQIQELTTGFAPKKIGVKRVGNDLHIQFEAGTQPDVIIENYYDSGVLPNELGGINEEHQLFDYLVGDAQDTFGMVELGGTSTAESVVGSGGVMETLGDWVWPLGLAVAAGGAGAAFGMGGGGGGKSAAKIATPKSAALIEEDTVDALTQKPTNTPNIFIQSPPKGMRAQLLVDGVEVEATLHQAADGRYYFVPSQALSEGQHTFTYHFVTAAGKAGANSPASIALIDTLVLDTPSTSPSIVGTGGTQTNQTTPTISLGKIQQGATPHLLVDGQDVPVTVSTDANGNVSITPTSPLSEGAHSIAYVYG
ncbi:MAG TPA: hypothetical protein DF614_02075, partial [Methylococcaceae bacterium]|nr:hypothetical protein [Methylococcaceae bacterium]